MCNLCTRAWIPANHRASHVFDTFGSKYMWKQIFRIKKDSFADIRRRSQMGHFDKYKGYGRMMDWSEPYYKQK